MAAHRPRSARDHADIAAFFDGEAGYAEAHGDAESLLRYRLDLLRDGARFEADDVVLEIGCGNGLHLLALADEFGQGIGIDLSPAMVQASRARAARTHGGPEGEPVRFAVDSAEALATIGDRSMDVVLCVGSLEHMLDQGAVLRSAYRVLRRGGRFVCLTLNGGSLWYRWLAPVLGVETRQLETDRYLTRRELADLARNAGFRDVAVDGWTFVQRGDIPATLAPLCAGLDRLGRLTRSDWLRGGLRVRSLKA